MSVILFRLACEKINRKGSGSITLRSAAGTEESVRELKVVPGTPGMAMARVAECSPSGEAWWQYFAISDLLSFKVYEAQEIKNDDEED